MCETKECVECWDAETEAYVDVYYLENRERKKALAKEYYQRNAETILEKRKHYRRENSERIALYKRRWRMRRKLSATRRGLVHKVTIYSATGGETEVYIRTGTYAKGKLGEVFLSVGKAGSPMKGMLDVVALEMSLLLQSGTPLTTLADKFKGGLYDPHGRTDNPDLPECTSIMDYVVRFLEAQYGN